MKTVLLSSLLIVTLFLMPSCGGDLYQTEIRTIDSLLTALDSAEKAFWTIDSAAARTAYADVNKDLGHLTNLIQDTLEKNEALLLSRYRGIRKPLREYLLKQTVMKKEITITRKQLEDLRHDLDKELLTKENAQLHFTKESGLARLLINSLYISTESVDIFLRRYAEVNPSIDSLVQVKEQQLQKKTIP
ncbi:MAG: hypothetical protein IT233_06275 [Bacteroidia bacterium]|nr:hypothetical protein [Bacteroidia bacterium]